MALVGLLRSLLGRQEPPKYLFEAPTRRQKGPGSAMMERLGFHNAVLESPNLILEPPGTNFESSGRCFGLPIDYLGATNMRSSHHIYPVASPVDYRRSGPGGMRVAIKSAAPSGERVANLGP